jgi:hypothetical protein
MNVLVKQGSAGGLIIVVASKWGSYDDWEIPVGIGMMK